MMYNTLYTDFCTAQTPHFCPPILVRCLRMEDGVNPPDPHLRLPILTCKLPMNGGWKRLEDSIMIKFMASLMAVLVASASVAVRRLPTCWNTDSYRRVKSNLARVLSRCSHGEEESEG